MFFPLTFFSGLETSHEPTYMPTEDTEKFSRQVGFVGTTCLTHSIHFYALNYHLQPGPKVIR